MKWRIESKGRFYDANEGTVVYFDSHSGDTHLLSDFAAYVLQRFEDRPLTIDDLTDQISPIVEPDQLPELAVTITGILTELVTLEILKRE